MWIIILKAFYFALPAYFATMAPLFLAKWKWFEFLNYPVDGNNKISGEYILGDHKTWRGFISAPIIGIVVAFIQFMLYSNPAFKMISIVDYSNYWLIFGLLAGLGAIVGDIIKSFFKRRLKIKPGRPWPFFDQIDATVGCIIFTYPIVALSWPIIISLILLALILAPIANITAYSFGLKKVWW